MMAVAQPFLMSLSETPEKQHDKNQCYIWNARNLILVKLIACHDTSSNALNPGTNKKVQSLLETLVILEHSSLEEAMKEPRESAHY